MHITIEITGRTLLRAFGCAAAIGGAAWLLNTGDAAVASQANVPHSFTGGTTISATQVNANFSEVQAAINDNHSRIEQLEALLAGLTRNADTLVLTGLNLQIQNGGVTSTDGTGNLIIGTNDDLGRTVARTGSHNLIMGEGHDYTGTNGIAHGANHTLAADNGVVLLGEFVELLQDDIASLANFAGASTSPLSINDARAVLLGEDATLVDIGLNGGEVFVGDGAATVDVGFGANFAFFGGQSNVCRLGNTAGLVAVGTAATSLNLGAPDGGITTGAGAVNIFAVGGIVVEGESVGIEANGPAVQGTGSGGIGIAANTFLNMTSEQGMQLRAGTVGQGRLGLTGGAEVFIDVLDTAPGASALSGSSLFID